jgi:uncharacterized protein DUF6496
MPEKRTIKKARRAKRAGKAPTTQAGEFVHTEIRKIRRGKPGARSSRQAIAIGLSKARRAGVDLPPPRKGRAKGQTRKSAEYAYEADQGRRSTRRKPRVSRAVSRVLKREPPSSAPRTAISRPAKPAASHRTAAQRSAAARKTVGKSAASRSVAARKTARSKGAAGRSAAARKTARTKARRNA